MGFKNKYTMGIARRRPDVATRATGEGTRPGVVRPAFEEAKEAKRKRNTLGHDPANLLSEEGKPVCIGLTDLEAI